MTLSVLTRMSFAVVWVALLGFEFLRILRKETKFVDKILPVGVSIIVFFSYYFWNKHIASENGTLFLGNLAFADSWSDFWNMMKGAKDNWQYHYFGKIHYYLFILILIFSILYFIYGKIKNRKIKTEKGKKPLSLWLLALLSIFGCFLFTIAMSKQFSYHDYYFLDTYFLPLLLLFVLILSLLPKTDNYKQGIVFGVISLVFIIMMLKNVSDKQKERRVIGKGRVSERTIKNYLGSERYLDSIGISRDAKILTLWAYPQNTPFILMNRKGYTDMWYEKEIVDASMSFPFDYVVIENEVYEKEKVIWKYLFDDLQYYSDNGKIMLFVKKEE